nr:DUF4124 domain-containing protein [Pseudoxanthomonas sp.]
MIRMITLLLLALPAAVAAQQLHKCVDPHGHASYQSAPCEAGHKQAWVRDATPEPSPPVRPRPTTRAATPSRISVPAAANLPAYPARAPAACEAAKRQRESTLKTVGLKRNFELLRRLDDAVWNACR